MKRSVSAVLFTSLTGCLVALATNSADAQGLPPAAPLGPQTGDAVLKMPGSDWSAAPMPPGPGNVTPYRPGNPVGSSPYSPGSSTPFSGNPTPYGPGNASLSSLPNAANPAVSAPFLSPTGVPQATEGPGSTQPSPGSLALARLAPRQGPDPNQDILVGPKAGPWMISVMCYTGPNAPFMARAMVGELRQNYHLYAYVCNYGAEERRKEYERVKAIVEGHQDFLRKNNLPDDQKIRIRYMRIEEQCGVLVGGYADEKQARRALDDIRKLKMPDPNRVALDTSSYQVRDPQSLKVERAERIYVNPFLSAFVVHNPSVPVERPSAWDKLDVAGLRNLNANMPYDIFQCPKPYTLAVKEYQLGTMIQPAAATGFLALGGKTGQREDGAAVSAHSLAALLTQAHLKAYVLHTKFSSVVTVGAFDRPDDPELLSMQNLLKTRLNLPNLELFPTPLPMQVPR